jgi:restriction system protein
MSNEKSKPPQIEGRCEELDLTPEDREMLDRAQNKVFEDMKLAGMPVFEPDRSKPMLPIDQPARSYAGSMAIPDYETLMLPVLKFAGDGEEHAAKELVASVSTQFHLSPEDQAVRLPSGQQTIIANRCGWATTYLKKAGLLVATRRGFFKITPDGQSVLKENPKAIDNAFLRKRSKQFVEFYETRYLKAGDEPKEATLAEQGFMDLKQTPEELLDRSYQALRNELASQILQRVQAGSAERFESVVVELLVKMGYGGSRSDAGEAVGRSGDGGIDGIIKEDRLGLDAIYIQAKRWDSQSVSRPEIQKFVGALQGVRAKKGVFITTSRFTEEAKKYAANVDTKIVLIDGPTLARYMIDFDLGVSPVTNYPIKRLDSDYFEEEE